MSEEAFQDAMNETMTPSAAARVLADAAGFEESLLQRTEGITAMIWSAVGPGIYLTYAFAGTTDAMPDWGWALLWIPWVFAGTLITYAIWRSAALSMPGSRDPITPLGYLARFFALTLAVSVIFAFWDPDHYGAPLLVIGMMYLAMGGLNIYQMSRRGRLVAIASGVGFLLIGSIAVSLPETGLGFVAAVTLSGLVPLFAGFWQTITS